MRLPNSQPPWNPLLNLGWFVEKQVGVSIAYLCTLGIEQERKFLAWRDVTQCDFPRTV